MRDLFDRIDPLACAILGLLCYVIALLVLYRNAIPVH